MLNPFDQWMVGFVIACLSALIWPTLPPQILLICAATVALLLLRYPRLSGFSGILAGVVWMASVGHWQQSWQLPYAQIHQPVTVTGQITSVVDSNSPGSFELKVESLSVAPSFAATIRLRWYQPKWKLKQGQRVRLDVKLKPPQGLSNAHGFNYQQWLVSRGIAATGYVRPSEDNVLLEKRVAIRQAMLDKLHELELGQKGLIAALGLGYRKWISDRQMAVIQRMGVAHLIAISGLHLSMVALLGYWLTVIAAACIPKLGKVRQPNLLTKSIPTTLLTCACYAYLSGFAVPVTRAWLWLAIVLALVWLGRHWRAPRLLLLLLTVILVIAPLSMLSISLWLSLGAVCFILFYLWCWPMQSGASVLSNSWHLIKLQIVLSLLMLPMVAWQFQMVSLAGVVVNLFSVPLFTFVLLPLTLLGVVVWTAGLPGGQLLLQIADSMFGVYIGLLESIEALSLSWVSVKALPLSVWALALIGFVVLLLPAIPIPRRYVLVLLLPIASWHLPAKAPYWQIDVMDVGQGLAVLVQQGSEALLYDVGPRFPGGFNMADAVILPYLSGQGIKQLEYVIISHGDNDHAGSLPILENNIRVKQLRSFDHDCIQGMNIQWGSLTIDALWPPPDFKGSDNNGSCVIRISDGRRSILLPGDIERSAEARIVETYGSALRADILIAPHHGSGTSSSKIFLDAVSPELAVFSQGFRNRWNFPRPDVIERYDHADITTFQTSRDGQIRIKMPYDEDSEPAVQTYRNDMRPYWYTAAVSE